MWEKLAPPMADLPLTASPSSTSTLQLQLQLPLFRVLNLDCLERIFSCTTVTEWFSTPGRFLHTR